MKKLNLALLILFASSCIFSSCSKKSCRGGGWYGNRNLSYIPTKIELNADIDWEKATAALIVDEK